MSYTDKQGNTSYEGAVLNVETRQARMFTDMDIEPMYYHTAVVWDEARKTVLRLTTTFYYGDRERASAAADATPEVWEKARGWAFNVNYNAIFTRHWLNNTRLDWTPEGSRVVVARGRKVKKGTTGVVKKLFSGQYGESALLVLDDGSEVWTASSNLDRVGNFYPDVEVIEREAADKVAQGSWAH